MKKFLFAALSAFALIAGAQSHGVYGFNIENVMNFIAQSERTHKPSQCAMIGSGTMLAMTKNAKAYRKMLEIAEQRIGNPQDSLYNDEIYIAMLQHAVDSFALAPSEKARPRLLLDNALKNRLGTMATDFSYTTPDGKQHKLSDLQGKVTLLYFNDPDCDACATVKERLATSDDIARLSQAGKLQVLAVYTGNDKKAWEKSKFPAIAINGWDKNGAIEQNELYIIPTMPLFYLIATDGTVVMKNVISLNRIERAFGIVEQNPEATSKELVDLLFNLY